MNAGIDVDIKISMHIILSRDGYRWDIFIISYLFLIETYKWDIS